MAWSAYQVIFRLRSPMHIGWGKVGNLQRTRPYVTGRTLWGALTMRLTRDADRAGGAVEYRAIGEQVHQHLAFTYFYPATQSGNDYQVAWPWENESLFRRRFLSSYQGTALTYPQQSAAEGMLHEVEFISPHTLDTGEAVFLKGYFFEKVGCQLKWQPALKRLQIGGERGYGWGDVELVNLSPCKEPFSLFGGLATFRGDGDIPLIQLPPNGRILSHAVAEGLPITGAVEPLVGREWRSDNKRRRYVGQHVEFSGLCFVPGSVISQALNFKVEKFGILKLIRDA